MSGSLTFGFLKLRVTEESRIPCITLTRVCSKLVRLASIVSSCARVFSIVVDSLGGTYGSAGGIDPYSGSEYARDGVQNP